MARGRLRALLDIAELLRRTAGLYLFIEGRAAKPAYLYFLPPDAPELNEIEPAFRAIKHHELPDRRYTTLPALLDAVTAAFTTYEEALIAKQLPLSDQQLRLLTVGETGANPR